MIKPEQMNDLKKKAGLKSPQKKVEPLKKKVESPEMKEQHPNKVCEIENDKRPAIERRNTDDFWVRLWRCGHTLQTVLRQDTKGHVADYCSIQHLFKVAKPILNNEGLAIFQHLEYSQDSKRNQIITRLYDLTSKEFKLTSSVDLQDIPPTKSYFKPEKPNKWGVLKWGDGWENASHEIGGLITYLRRYAIFTILGILPEKDHDGKQGNWQGQK